MKKRIIALILTLFSLITAVPFSVSANPGDGQIGGYSDKVVSIAEDLAEVVASFGSSLEFKEAITYDEMRQAISLTFNQNPWFFYLSNNYSYVHETDAVTGETAVYSIIPRYTKRDAEYTDALAEVEKWVDYVTGLADPSFTDLEYALFFHDWLASNYAYDSSYTSYNVYTLITTGAGVCQAYTYAYSILLDAVGVEVSWALSEEMNHIWNLVRLDGEWYHVDVTNDDPVGSAPGLIRHKYFLLSDAAISTEENNHYAWTSLYTCTSDRFDSSWLLPIDTPMTSLAGKWYYVKDGDLYAASDLSAPGKPVLEYDMKWKTDSGNAHYTRSYSGIAALGDKLYFNSPTALMMYDPITGKASEVYTHTGDGYIFGFITDLGENGTGNIGADDATILLNIGTSPSDSTGTAEVKVSAKSLSGAGDANSDGKVSLADVALILRHIAGWDVTVNAKAADTDNDSKITLNDAQYVLKAIAGWF